MTDAVHTAAPLCRVAVFGLDDAGKPHASRFAGEEAELAVKAAGLMAFHTVALGPDHDDLAQALPQGRVFASGKAFVPFAKKPLYDRLAALAGLPVAEAAVGAASPKGERRPAKADKPETAQAKRKKIASTEAEAVATTTPTDWAQIGPGSLVLVTHGGAFAPWHEAVVIGDKGDDLFELRWRDWPKERPFLRRRDQLGLLPSGEQPDA